MNPNVFERVRDITADVLQCSSTQITPQSSSETVDSWDSVHHLNLILALEHEFGLQFEPEEIEKMINVASILSVLERRLGQPSS
jgi:acyl carrier protein